MLPGNWTVCAPGVEKLALGLASGEGLLDEVTLGERGMSGNVARPRLPRGGTVPDWELCRPKHLLVLVLR
jgi:hypothetical protein